MTSTDFVQDIYLVQTDVNQKKVPKDWIRSGGTKVGFRMHRQLEITRLTMWIVCFEMEGELLDPHDSKFERSNRKSKPSY